MNDAVSPLIAKSGAFQDVLKCIREGNCPARFLASPRMRSLILQEAAARGSGAAGIVRHKYGAGGANTRRRRACSSENDYSIRAAQAKGREEELVRVKVMKNAGIIKKPVFLSIRAFLGKLVPKEKFDGPAC